MEKTLDTLLKENPELDKRHYIRRASKFWADIMIKRYRELAQKYGDFCVVFRCGDNLDKNIIIPSSYLNDVIKKAKITDGRRWFVNIKPPTFKINWGTIKFDGKVFLNAYEFLEKPSQLPELPKEERLKEERITVFELCENLLKAERDSSNPKNFEKLLSEAFDVLGFETKLIGGANDTDVLINAPIGEECYKVIIDGKTNQKGKVADNQIKWKALKKHRRKHDTELCAIVGPGFASGDLLRNADEEKVTLIETSTLIEILKRCEKTPFSLLDLKPIFEIKGIVTLDMLKTLLEKSESYENRFQLIFSLIAAIQEHQSSMPELSARDLYWILNRKYSEEDIKNALVFLSAPPLSAVTNSKRGGYILTSHPKIIAERLKILANGLERRKP